MVLKHCSIRRNLLQLLEVSDGREVRLLALFEQVQPFSFHILEDNLADHVNELVLPALPVQVFFLDIFNRWIGCLFADDLFLNLLP